MRNLFWKEYLQCWGVTCYVWYFNVCYVIGGVYLCSKNNSKSCVQIFFSFNLSWVKEKMNTFSDISDSTETFSLIFQGVLIFTTILQEQVSIRRRTTSLMKVFPVGVLFGSFKLIYWNRDKDVSKTSSEGRKLPQQPKLSDPMVQTDIILQLLLDLSIIIRRQS